MRIHEAAKQFNIDSKIIIDRLAKLGITVKSHMSSMDDALYLEMKNELSKGSKPAEKEALQAAVKPAPAPAVPEKKAEVKPAAHAIKPGAPAVKPEPLAVKPAPIAPVAAPVPIVSQPPVPVAAAVEVKKEELPKEIVDINRGPTVSELASKFEIRPTEIIKKLMGLGVLATMNQSLGDEEVQLLADEYHKSIVFKDLHGDEHFEDEEPEKPETLKPRAPIVTIMGHVDHGKTSLLDAVRASNVVATERGGITQRIGAYKVKTKNGEIVFIDTPGHEAFTAMRARGAQVTDIVILIVAADDGVMPQTKEAIDHARAANAPIIVAINKIDKDGAQPDRVKQELMKYNLISEEWGGKTQFVQISAKKKIGIQELLDVILLEAEMLELKTNPDRMAVGTVIEAKLDKGRGAVATVLVQKGTVKVGDPFITNYTYGKVRAIIDDHGARLKEARAVVPIEILGFDNVPNAGEKFKVLGSEKEVKQVASKRSNDLKRITEEKKKKKLTLEDFHKKIKLGAEKKLPLIIKGDSQGSIEALNDAIGKLSTQTDVQINTIHRDVGDITESDVLLADASDAVVIGFFVAVLPAAKEIAKKEGVEIKIYHIIFEVINAIKAAIEGMLEPEYEEVKIGEGEVRQVFKIESEAVIIAGSYLKAGKVYSDSIVMIKRNGYEIIKGPVKSLKRFKDNVKEVKEGYEFGFIIDKYEPAAGDTLVFFEEVQKVKKI